MQKTVTALLQHHQVITENSDAARQLLKSHFGTKLSDGRIRLAAVEALYLAEKKRLLVVNGKNKQLSFDRLLLKLKYSKELWTAYVVFRDLRENGYIVKAGTKFGGEFRAYDKDSGMREHSKWIVFPVHARQKLLWQDFSAKVRVAHSTQKKLLVAVVDEEDRWQEHVPVFDDIEQHQRHDHRRA